MLWFVKKFGKSLLTVGSLVGLLYLPADIIGYAEAIKPLQPIVKCLMSLDRETLFIGLAILLTIWIVWTDLRPFVRKAIVSWRIRNEPILRVDFPNDINSDAKYGLNKRSAQFLPKDAPGRARMVRSTYFLGLTNSSDRTIRNVSVHARQVDNPIVHFLERKLVTPRSEASVDMPPGYTAFFQIGFVHRWDAAASGEHAITATEFDFQLLDNEWEPHYGFKLMFEKGISIPLLKNNGLRLIINVYGDDVPAKMHQFTINCRDLIEIYYDGPINQDEDLALQ